MSRIGPIRTFPGKLIDSACTGGGFDSSLFSTGLLRFSEAERLVTRGRPLRCGQFRSKIVRNCKISYRTTLL